MTAEATGASRRASAVVSRATRLVAAIAVAALVSPAALAAEKTLRLQMLADVEVLDPARAGSLSTLNTIGPLYHQLLTYDYLARPVKLIPYAAESLPQVSADGRTYTLRIRPGLLFAPHPAFGGKAREVVAQDFVYGAQRIVDELRPALLGCTLCPVARLNRFRARDARCCALAWRRTASGSFSI